jgi:WD40 repeat protein
VIFSPGGDSESPPGENTPLIWNFQRKYILKESYIVFILLISVYLCHAQNKQDYVWLFGLDKTSSEEDLAYSFDFNISPFEIQQTNVGIGIGGNNASICDEDGDLLFYSNGCAILNREGEIMPDGDSINYNYWYELLWGGNCLYGYPGAQNIMILPDPENSNGYYVFHKPRIYIQGADNPNELWYSYVDMSLDDGRGDVVLKNQKYYDKQNTLSSFFTALQHENGEDWWIIQPVEEDSLFLTFLLTKDSIERKQDQNSHEYFLRDRTSAGGTSRFSPDGTKLALYTYYNQLHIYDFDRTTGTISNHRKISIYENPDYNDLRFSSVEWSSNSRFIYTASKLELHQVDTWEEDMNEGIRLIDVYNGTQDPLSTTFYMMALGPDCRIYMAPTSGTRSYHVINHPDSLGTACDFVQNGIKLPFGSNVGSMPNFPRFRVDEEEKCDPTIVSVFGEAVWYKRDLKIWPNPSSGVFHVELPEAVKGRLVVMDMNGQIVHDIEVRDFYDPSKVQIDISDFPAGVFHVEFWQERNLGSKAKPLNSDRVFYGTQVVKVE